MAIGLREGIITIAGVLVAGIIIAGQTIGWEKFLAPMLQQPRIEISSTVRPSTKTFFASEKMWLKLANVETDRVYWLFDEDDSLIRGGVQIQHGFDFDPKTPTGTETYRRVDAFYKDGDQYRTSTSKIAVSNLQVKAEILIKSEMLNILADSYIKGAHEKWKISSASLAKYNDGNFEDTRATPISLVTTGYESKVTWDLNQAVAAYGYKSKEDFYNVIIKDNRDDRILWVTITYSSKSGKPLTIVKPIKGISP